MMNWAAEDAFLGFLAHVLVVCGTTLVKLACPRRHNEGM